MITPTVPAIASYVTTSPWSAPFAAAYNSESVQHVLKKMDVESDLLNSLLNVVFRYSGSPDLFDDGSEGRVGFRVGTSAHCNCVSFVARDRFPQ